MHIFIVKGTPTERKGSEWLLQVASSSLGSGSSQQFINLGAEDLQTRWLRGEEWLPHDQNSNLGSRWLTWELYHTSLSFSVKWLSSSSPFKVVETTNWDLLPKTLIKNLLCVSSVPALRYNDDSDHDLPSWGWCFKEEDEYSMSSYKVNYLIIIVMHTWWHKGT